MSPFVGAEGEGVDARFLNHSACRGENFSHFCGQWVDHFEIAQIQIRGIYLVL